MCGNFRNVMSRHLTSQTGANSHEGIGWNIEDITERRPVTLVAFGLAPALNQPVNRRDPSTGETGEFAGENVGFGLNLGVELAPPPCLCCNRRERTARKNLRNVGDISGKRKCAAVNKTHLWSWD
jgi:hypothetical protein